MSALHHLSKKEGHANSRIHRTEQTASNPANRIGLLHLSEPLLIPTPFPRVGEVVPQWLRNLAAISQAHAVTILWEDPRHSRRPDHRFYHDMAFYQMPDGEWLTFNLGSGRRTRDFNITWRQDPGVGYMDGLQSIDVGPVLHSLRPAI